MSAKRVLLAVMASCLFQNVSAQTTCLGINCDSSVTDPSETWRSWGESFFESQVQFFEHSQDFDTPERRVCVDQCKIEFMRELSRCDAQFPKDERRSIEYAWMMKPAYNRCIEDAQDKNYECLGLMSCPPASGGR